MKNVVIIPVEANNEDDLELPIGEVNGTTLLQTVYERAKSVSLVDHVLVTSNSKLLGRYCADKGIPFFPSSQQCPTGTHRCAAVVSRFDPVKAKTVGNIICWPVTYPHIQGYDIDDMISKYRSDGIMTLVRNIYEGEREGFNQDPTKVKVRAYTNRCTDFTRCPLPMALYHVGIYLYTIPELQKAATIAPTKLSIEEGLEQLAWMQYGIPIFCSLLRRHTGNPEFVAIRSKDQLPQLVGHETST